MKCTNGKPPMLSIYDGRICCDTRARAAQADLFFKECLEIADRGKDSENESQARIQRDRLRVDTRKWMAARLAAFRSKATEILYRGAAGGGKPHLMRAAA